MKKLYIIITFLFSSIFNIASAGEIAHYQLDGNANDSGPLSLNGVIVDKVSLGTDRFGNYGKSLRFNGGLIRIDGFRNYIFGNELTISVWIKRTVESGYMGIINNGFTRKSFDLRMGRENRGTFIFNQSDLTSGRVGVSSSGFITLDQWYNVVVTIKDGLSTLYINGQKLAENAVNPGDLITSNLPIIIGANSYGLGHAPFKGELDDIWLFNNALSDSDIVALYNGTYQPSYEVTAIPHSGQLDIPSSGGSMLYDVTMTHSGSTLNEDFKYWGIITLPTGEDYSVLLPESVSIPAGETVSLNNLELNIPAWFPDGEYTYRWYISDPSQPNGNILQSSFTFNKTP